MAIKTYNIQLSADQDFRDFWVNILTQTRDAYNRCSLLISYKNLSYSLKQVHHECYFTLREEFQTLPSQSIIRIEREVVSAYKSRKSNKQHGSLPQKRSLSMTLDKRIYSNFTRDGISLTSDIPNKRKRFSFELYPKVNELFATSIAKDPTIFYRNGSLWLSVPFELNGCMPESITSVGVDLGMKRLFVTSEGVAFQDKNYLRERRKVRYLKRCLSSKGTKSAKRHKKNLRKREYNLSKDMCHRACNELLASTKASFVVMEDLSKIKIKTSKTEDGVKRKRHNNAFGQVPFYMFKQILTYKATLVGKQVVSVSPCFTSQTDSRSSKKEGIRSGCRFYCVDGVVLDADWNAAVNIAQKSKHPLSANILPIDGNLSFLSGRHSSVRQSSNDLSRWASPLL